MKSIFYTIFCGLIATNLSHAQDAPTSTTPASTIKITTTSQLSAGPDEITAQITLTEYVHTDPKTQETTSVTLEEIKKELESRIKKLGKDPHSLQFVSVAEGNMH